MYEIEKDIPLPDVGGNFAKYPYKKMEIGDSFLADKKAYAAVRNWVFRTMSKKRFSARRENGAIRIWRIK